MESITQALEMSALLADLRQGRVNIIAAIAAIELELAKQGIETTPESASRAAAKSAAAVKSGHPRPLEGLPILADRDNAFAVKLGEAGAIFLGPAGPDAATAVASGNAALAVGNVSPDGLSEKALCGLWRQSYGIIARAPQDIATALHAVTDLRAAQPITRVATIPVTLEDRAERNAFRLAGEVLKGMHLTVEQHTAEEDGNTLAEQQALLAVVGAILLPFGTPHPSLPTMLLPAGYLPKKQAVILRLVARAGNSEGLLQLAMALSKALGWKRQPS